MNAQKLVIDYITSECSKLAGSIDLLEMAIEKQREIRDPSKIQQARLANMEAELEKARIAITDGEGKQYFAGLIKLADKLADSSLFYNPQKVSEQVKEMFENGIELSDEQFNHIWENANLDERRYIEARTNADQDTLRELKGEQKEYKKGIRLMIDRYREILTGERFTRRGNRQSTIKKYYPSFADLADNLSNYAKIEPKTNSEGKKIVWFDLDNPYELQEEGNNE